MTAPVEAALRKRYPCAGVRPEWAIMFEVRDAGGFNASRSLDAMALSLWPSGGHELHGIEIKSSRNDWLREKKDMLKSDTFFRYCDRFWLCTTHENVCPVDELPKKWGLMLLRGSSLVTLKAAPKLTRKPMPRGMLASLVKRSMGGEPVLLEQIAKLKADVERLTALADGRVADANDSKVHMLRRDLEREIESMKPMRELMKVALGVEWPWEASQLAQAIERVRGEAHLAQIGETLTDRIKRVRLQLTDLVDAKLAEAERDVATVTAFERKLLDLDVATAVEQAVAP